VRTGDQDDILHVGDKRYTGTTYCGFSGFIKAGGITRSREQGGAWVSERRRVPGTEAWSTFSK
jgi:hypothetical protein